MLPLITRAVALSFLALLRWRNSLLRIRFVRLAFPGSMDGRAAIEPGAAVRERSCEKYCAPRLARISYSKRLWRENQEIGIEASPYSWGLKYPPCPREKKLRFFW